jgi:hypothetical protein
MMMAVLIILGANYPQGGKQNEQMAQSGTMASGDRSFPISNKADSKSDGVSDTRSVSRISNEHSNNSNQRSSNPRDTVRPTTERTGGQQQQPRPAKPVTPSKPPQTKPEPEKPKADPVYLLNVDTPIAKVKALPTKKKKSLIKLEVNINGNKAKTDTSIRQSAPPRLQISTKIHHYP